MTPTGMASSTRPRHIHQGNEFASLTEQLGNQVSMNINKKYTSSWQHQRKPKSLSEEEKQLSESLKDIKSFHKSLQNEAKVFRQLKRKGHSLIHDSTSSVNKEFIKALADAHNVIMEHEEQVSLAFIS